MEEIKYTYHFSLHLRFKKNVDVCMLEKHFKIPAYKKTFLKDSKGKNKTAKLWYKSKDFNNVFTDNQLEKFMKTIYENFIDLKQILSENEGDASLTLYFTQTKERPVIGLTLPTIEIFEKLGIAFDVDFG